MFLTEVSQIPNRVSVFFIDNIIAFLTLPNENGMSDTYIIMDSYYDNRYSADDFALVIDETVMTVREYKQKVR